MHSFTPLILFFPFHSLTDSSPPWLSRWCSAPSGSSSESSLHSHKCDTVPKAQKQTIMMALLKKWMGEWTVAWITDGFNCCFSISQWFSENSGEKQKVFIEKHPADVCSINEFNYRYCMPSGACLIFGSYVNIISLWGNFSFLNFTCKKKKPS